MKKPIVHFDSSGESGNTFLILGLCQAALAKDGRTGEYKALTERVFGCHSYAEALDIIRETIDLIDIQGEK